MQNRRILKWKAVCPRQQASSAVALGSAVGCSQLIQFANPQAALLSWELLGAVNSSSPPAPGVKTLSKNPTQAFLSEGWEVGRVTSLWDDGEAGCQCLRGSLVCEAVEGPAVAEPGGGTSSSLAGSRPSFAGPAAAEIGPERRKLCGSGEQREMRCVCSAFGSAVGKPLWRNTLKWASVSRCYETDLRLLLP